MDRRIDTMWPRVGWTYDPTKPSPKTIAHAAYSREKTALCGMHTPYLGAAWPATAAAWILPDGRCPSCAHRLYSSDRL